ncbi:MAG: Na+:solute symporter, partial [Acidobacteria bacterium]|nr:Na+:solute symporter [Acidobacteriota bacterium]
SQQEYFLAGREATGWQAGLSMAASQYAADTPLLATGLMATAGVYALWRFWIYGFGYLLLGFVFAELWRRARVLTDAELTETRYSGAGVLALRTLKAVYYGTIVNCFFLAMVLIAAVRVAEVFLPWHEWLPRGVYEPLQAVVAALGISLGAGSLDPATAATNGLISILAIVSFVLLYSATGGLRGVIATDVVQFGCIMVGTFAYAWLIMAEVGGPSAFGERMVELYGRARSEELTALMPSDGAVLWPFLAILGLQGLFWISSDGTGYLAQRAMACRSDQDARIAGVVTTWAQMFFRSLIWLVIGAGLLVLYPFTPAEAAQQTFAATRELAFIRGIDDLMPPGLRGVMLVGILAAVASTVDTHLNWGASYWSVDLYDRLYCRAWKKREPTQRALLRAARLSNVVILLIALTVMVNLGSIQATWFISLVFGAGIGGVLMLRWLWGRINLWSEVAAIAVSLLASPFILAWVDEEWQRLAWIVALSNGAAIATALWGPATDRAVLQRFYDQVRPVGWWRALAGDERPLRALRKRLRFIVWMTASLFLALIGSTKLLLPLPGDSSVWGWASLALAAALVPLWLPALRAETFEE